MKIAFGFSRKKLLSYIPIWLSFSACLHTQALLFSGKHIFVLCLLTYVHLCPLPLTLLLPQAFSYHKPFNLHPHFFLWSLHFPTTSLSSSKLSRFNASVAIFPTPSTCSFPVLPQTSIFPYCFSVEQGIFRQVITIQGWRLFYRQPCSLIGTIPLPQPFLFSKVMVSDTEII